MDRLQLPLIDLSRPTRYRTKRPHIQIEPIARASVICGIHIVARLDTHPTPLFVPMPKVHPTNLFRIVRGPGVRCLPRALAIVGMRLHAEVKPSSAERRFRIRIEIHCCYATHPRLRPRRPRIHMKRAHQVVLAIEAPPRRHHKPHTILRIMKDDWLRPGRSFRRHRNLRSRQSRAQQDEPNQSLPKADHSHRSTLHSLRSNLYLYTLPSLTAAASDQPPHMRHPSAD